MANSIYKSDNYLIVETTENQPPFDPLNKQLPQKTTVYNRNTEDGRGGTFYNFSRFY